MPTYSRLFISATLIALLTVSSLFVNLKPVRACPLPPPQTLLQLFMESDLAIAADVTGEKLLKQDDQNEYGYWAELKKDVRPVKIYKGNPPRDLSFEDRDFFARTTNDDGTSNGEEERTYALLPGKRYLLFLRKNEKSGAYELIPTSSASRELETADEGLYDERLSELAAILKARKDQLPTLTEWLVKLTEEPATLYDGVSDLRSTFDALSDSDAEEEEEAGDDKAVFHLAEYSQVSLPDIAESLTNSQKQRISSVLDRQLHDVLAAAVPEGDEPASIELDYDFVRLVCNWDREHLTIGANALLLNSDPADSRRVDILMTLIGYAINDEELNSLWERYREAADGEISGDAADAGETVPENAGVPAESGGGEKPAGPDNTANTDEGVTKAGEDAAAAKKVKRDRLMAALVWKYSDRYQHLLARGFEKDEEMETADEASEILQSPREIKYLPLINPIGDPQPDGN